MLEIKLKATTVPYSENSLQKLARAVPMWNLVYERQFTAFLSDTVQTGEELTSILTQYPYVKYEPLDFHYVCLQSLAVLDEELITELLSAYEWKSALWGAFLVCLYPDTKYLPALKQMTERFTKHSAVVGLALRILQNCPAKTDCDCLVNLQKLREQLGQCTLPTVQLQAAISPAEFLLLQEKVKAAYQQYGVDAAISLLK